MVVVSLSFLARSGVDSGDLLEDEDEVVADEKECCADGGGAGVAGYLILAGEGGGRGELWFPTVWAVGAGGGGGARSNLSLHPGQILP